MSDLRILTILIFIVSIVINWLVFSIDINLGSALISISFLCVSLAVNYWVFFTPSGKAFTKKYNDEAKKQAEKRSQDFKLYFRTRATVFSDLEGFHPSHIIFSFDNKTGIAIDETSKNVCLLKNNNHVMALGYFDTRSINRSIISYRDILEVAIFEDGDSITKTSRTSQLAGAIIGNIMLGGVGLVIGSLTGAKRTSSIVNSLEVRLIINNTQSPIISIAFIPPNTPKKGHIYKKALDEANRLNALVKVLMKKADDEDNFKESQQNQAIHKVQESVITPNEKAINTLELAKIGDTKAITTLLNRSLNTKGITARAKIKETTLKISLASEVAPDQDRIVPFIHKGIMELNITSIENVEILGYRLGDSSPSWSRKLEI
jgi:hypothetical protein